METENAHVYNEDTQQWEIWTIEHGTLVRRPATWDDEEKS